MNWAGNVSNAVSIFQLWTLDDEFRRWFPVFFSVVQWSCNGTSPFGIGFVTDGECLRCHFRFLEGKNIQSSGRKQRAAHLRKQSPFRKKSSLGAIFGSSNVSFLGFLWGWKKCSQSERERCFIDPSWDPEVVLPATVLGFNKASRIFVGPDHSFPLFWQIASVITKN